MNLGFMFSAIWRGMRGLFGVRRHRVPRDTLVEKQVEPSAAVQPAITDVVTAPASDQQRPATASPLPPKGTKKVDKISAYEKQRRKHDKFVTPGGERPERKTKPRAVTQEIKPEAPPKPDIDPESEPKNGTGIYDDFTLVDRHHEGGEDVLYKVEEMQGEFNFRDTILQQLDRYFFYLKRMRKQDPDAYHLYRQVGATLLPYIATGSWDRTGEKEREEHTPISPLPPVFNKVRPAFGCFVYGADPETEKFEQTYTDDKKLEMWVPKFLYFSKYKMPPSSVQPMGGGDIYSLTVWWDRPDKKRKYGVPQSMPFYISADGKTVLALKILETKWNGTRGYIRQYAGMKPSRRHRKRPTVDIPHKAWRFPLDYKQWAARHNETVEHFLAGLFVDSIIRAENARMSMTRVAATKDDMTAVFAVNINRTSYFFQDRDISVTKNGTRERIFHAVKPHVRSDGTAVKMHFRGSRDFTWAGYDVHISVPGRDHNDIAELGVGMVDSEWIPPDETGWADGEEVGRMLSDHMRRGWGAR